MIEFDDERLERYGRHILLDGVGIKGQRRLWNARVLIVGVGGLGSPVALYLAAAGLGTLGLADADTVDLSNLQRQIIHSTPDIGRAKVVSATEKIARLNPDVSVRVHPEFVVAANAREIVSDYDFIVDATDGPQAKFLINDVCVALGKPFSHGGVLGFQGQTMTVVPGKSACCRCVFGGPPPPGASPTCREAGVLGSVAGMLGTIQATEVLKFILGVGRPLTDTLLTFEALDMDFRRLKTRRDPRCAACGEGVTTPDSRSV